MMCHLAILTYVLKNIVLRDQLWLELSSKKEIKCFRSQKEVHFGSENALTE